MALTTGVCIENNTVREAGAICQDSSDGCSVLCFHGHNGKCQRKPFFLSIHSPCHIQGPLLASLSLQGDSVVSHRGVPENRNVP